MRTYDKDPKSFVIAETTGGLSIPGTAAADTELIRFPITEPLRMDKIRLVAMTGGTADGPIVGVGKSLAGTGAIVAIATQNIGTSANNTGFSLVVSDVDATASVAEGDHLVIYNSAGTAASTPAITLNIQYRPDFDC